MYIGVDIGGTKILVAASDDKLALDRSEKIETPADGAQATAEIIHLIEKVAGNGQLTAIGIACAGPLDTKAGRVLNPPNLKWRNLDIVAPLKRHFGVPVQLENDANAAGLAEAELGAGVGFRQILYVTISTGIGTGLIIDGRIYHGAGDTEGGYVTIDTSADAPACGCGGKGHFEAVVSGKAIKRRFGLNAYQIDPKDHAVWEAIGKDIAAGLGSLISAYCPDALILGGGVNVHYPKFKKYLHQYLDAYHLLYPLPQIRQAKLVETAAVMGALILAKRAK